MSGSHLHLVRVEQAESANRSGFPSKLPNGVVHNIFTCHPAKCSPRDKGTQGNDEDYPRSTQRMAGQKSMSSQGTQEQSKNAMEERWQRRLEVQSLQLSEALAEVSAKMAAM